MEQNTISKSLILDVLKHVLYNIIVYYLFVLPVDLWKKSVIRLHNQRTEGKLKINSSKRWPFLSFLVAFFFEFLIDTSIFLCYILGPIGLVLGFLGMVSNSFTAAVGGLVVGAIGVLWSPVIFTLQGEFLRMSLLPIKKFILWCDKPPQHLDIDMRNKH